MLEIVDVRCCGTCNTTREPRAIPEKSYTADAQKKFAKLRKHPRNKIFKKEKFRSMKKKSGKSTRNPKGNHTCAFNTYFPLYTSADNLAAIR